MYIQLSLSHFSNLHSLQTYFVVEKVRTELIPLRVKLTNTKKKRMSITYLLSFNHNITNSVTVSILWWIEIKKKKSKLESNYIVA